MRNYRGIPPVRKKEEGDLLAKITSDPSEEGLYELAALVYKLGFDSKQIRDLASLSADREIARNALLRARKPGRYQYDAASFENFINQMVSFFNSAKEETSDSMITDMISSSGTLPKRCGIPRNRDYEQDQPLLFMDNMHDVEGEREITSFFVRRSVYFAFFGKPSRTDGNTNYEQERERAEATRQEQERQEQGKQEQERKEQERQEQERQEQERQERERQERVEQATRLKYKKQEQERARRETKLRKERGERQERERAKQEQATRFERERLEREQTEEAERAQVARLERDRLEREQAEQAERAQAARLERERLEREQAKRATKLEQERLEKERAEQAPILEYEREGRGKAEQERQEREKAEQADLLDYERQEEAEQATRLKEAGLQLEAARLERKRLERAERQEQDRTEQARLTQERKRRQAERDRRKQERLALEQQTETASSAERNQNRVTQIEWGKLGDLAAQEITEEGRSSKDAAKEDRRKKNKQVRANRQASVTHDYSLSRGTDALELISSPRHLETPNQDISSQVRVQLPDPLLVLLICL
jgi:hypothetical protein